jgi:hypothetical protein
MEKKEPLQDREDRGPRSGEGRPLPNESAAEGDISSVDQQEGAMNNGTIGTGWTHAEGASPKEPGGNEAVKQNNNG